MIPILTLIMLMAVAAILGAQRWRGKTSKYLLITLIALIQTALILFDMFTMKTPKM